MAFNLAVILRESALAAPDQPVALFGDDRMTYRELDELSDQLATGLRASGAGPGSPVGLQLPNIPQFLIAYFGILKAGCIAVPMNVLLKAPEVAFQLRDSGAMLLITWEGVLGEAAKAAAEAGTTGVFAVGHSDGRPDARPFEHLLAIPAEGPQLASREPTDTAVVMYTSGTTGRPKGAALSHIQLYMNADIPGRLFGVLPSDVVITVLPLFHVFGLSSILDVCVRFGCTMSLIPHFDPIAVLSAIQRDRATIFEGVPAMFISLLTHPHLDSYDISSLRIAISGGASIPGPVLDEFERRFGVLILEGYGLTETASTTTFNRSASERRIYSVGKPIWGTQTQVWDKRHNALPPGREQVGEVVTRGLHVMKGYLNNPGANAQVFSGDWFHTGDLGYIDEDGFLFIVGRIKELIIRGGYNVYPAEVEAVIHQHPAVAEVAVVGIPDDRLGEEVKAVVVLRPGEALTARELIAFCKERMAAYKYPRTVEFRPQLPKNTMGKIVKDELTGQSAARVARAENRA
jgi:long-chain acyl-CoA synthetase